MNILELWINAFIPGDVKDYTVTIPKGTYAGQTAVPMPLAGGLANPENIRIGLNDWPKASVGYKTDQRGFSDNRYASVRMQSWAELEISHEFVGLHKQDHRTSGTVAVVLDSGAVVDSQPAVMTACNWRTWREGNNMRLVLGLVGRASDPLVRLAANIDYNGRFDVVHHGGRLLVSFKGLLDEFPAFEAYTRYKGRTQQLFRSPPPEGNTVTDLVGGAWRPVAGNVSFDR